MQVLYGELLALRPSPKLEDNPSSAACDCLFNIFAVTLHKLRPSQPENTSCLGGRDLRYTWCPHMELKLIYGFVVNPNLRH